MIYSVWEHANRRYVYYRTPERSDAVNAPSPKHLSGGSEIGLTDQEAAWPLPSDAVLVGYGKTPKGYIACRKGLPAKPLFWVAAGILFAYLVRE